MASIFRIDQPDVNLPDFIFIDTNFLIQLITNENKHCISFFSRLIDNQSIIIYTPLIVEEYTCIQVRAHFEKIAEEKGLDPEKWAEIQKQQPKLIVKAIKEAESTLYLLDEYPNVDCIDCNLDKEFISDAFDLMTNFYLLPMDAFHIVSAKREGINTFATLDSDFLRVHNIDVYRLKKKKFDKKRVRIKAIPEETKQPSEKEKN